MGSAKQEGVFEYAQNAQIQIRPAHAQSLIQAFALHSFMSNDSLSRQRRPRSDCAFAQSDLGLRCPHMIRRHIWRGLYIMR